MLLIISPAKTLDFETPPRSKLTSIPDFLPRSSVLIDELRGLSPANLSDLMSISEKLGELNCERFLNWHTPFDSDNAKQALLAFKGDVYTGLDADSLSAKDFRFAQKHLRILSGLYGLLRPMDLIQAYRLEMGTKFNNSGGANLYQFWGDTVTEAINVQLAETRSKVLVNLASNEYYKVVNKKLLAADVITPVFKDLKNDKYKIISFYAKKARGMMSAYVIKNQLKNVEQLKQFDGGGYRYCADQSTARDWVFTRDQAPV